MNSLKIRTVIKVPEKVFESGVGIITGIDTSEPHPAKSHETWNYLVAEYDMENNNYLSRSVKVTNREMEEWIDGGKNVIRN